MNSEIKKNLQISGLFSYLDIYFANFIEQLDGRKCTEIFSAAALVSHYNREGHICLDLKSVAGKSFFTEKNKDHLLCPRLDVWLKKLRGSPVVGKPGEYKPLILDDSLRLYLYRYWEYQEKLANSINSRVRDKEKRFDLDSVKENLEKYFPQNQEDDIDWQKIAGLTSLLKKFCVISGGPGTGKTTIIGKIMAFLLEQNGSKPLRIALAAPTGKAAARLKEAIKVTKRNLNCSEKIKEAIPEEASTIHRMLGSIPNSPYFQYNTENPFPVDVMIVDEASMVDLALMSKLVQALPLQSKLILVGDKDQLASVEAGAMLGDICDTGNIYSYSKPFCAQIESITDFKLDNLEHDLTQTGIQDCMIQLQKSYRFGSHSGIGAVSRAVNSGNGIQAIEILKGDSFQDINWVSLPQPKVLPQFIKEKIVQGFRDYLKANHPEDSFQLLNRFRILCALRQGPYGVNSVNEIVMQILKGKRLITPDKVWYHGRPIMITTNDYYLQLFNGDIGVALYDRESNNEIRVFFMGSDNTIRKFNPLRLPSHETVYAMTVHKSQGSEFDHVLLLLPDTDSPVLTRELIYTGITRARKNVEVWGVEQIFKEAVARRIERTSGLRDALWD